MYTPGEGKALTMAEPTLSNAKRTIPAGSRILMVTGDLMFSSNVDFLARQAGVVFESVSAGRLAAAGPARDAFALVDMANMDAAAVGQTVQELKELGAERIAVFGRHDRMDLRNAALGAGAAYWWPNSKMSAQMGTLLGLTN